MNIKLCSFIKKMPTQNELASYSIGSACPLKGCSSAEPFSVLADTINVELYFEIRF
jgi:hypothetical protein